MGHVRRGRPAGAHRRAAASGSGARSPSTTTCGAGSSRAPSPTCARAARGASRSRTGRRRADCTTPRSTSAGRSSSSSRGACSRWRSSRPTGACCASSSSPTATATELRITQRGFEGNEEWLADFRGGWGSFSDRLAHAVRDRRDRDAAPPRGDARRRAHARAGRAAPARSRSSRGARCRTAVLVRRRRRRSRSCCPASTPADGYEAPPRRSLRRALPRVPADGRSAGRAREPRALAAAPRLDGRRPAARGRRPGAPEAGCELALPYRPALDAGDPEPFVRAFERAFCAPGRAAAAAYFAPARRVRAGRRAAPAPARHAARAPSGAGPSRASGACACAGRRAHRRLGGQRLDGRTQPRHEHVDVRRRRPHRAARAALRPGRRRAWSPHDRCLGDSAARGARRPRAHAAGRARRRRARRLARDRASRRR